MSKNITRNSFTNWWWVLILLVVVIIIVVTFFDKDKEKKELEKTINRFNEKISEIELTYAKRLRQFNIAYNVLRYLFLIVCLGICAIVIYFTNSSNFFAYLSNCVEVFAALGMLLLAVCIFSDSNPKNIFQLRAFLKNTLNNYFLDPVKEDMQRLLILKRQKMQAEQRLLEINNELSGIKISNEE